MPFIYKPTSLGQFAVLVVAVLLGCFALGVACIVIAMRSDARDVQTAGQLMKIGCAFIAVSFVGSGIIAAARRWLD